jgi:hypothetical protein
LILNNDTALILIGADPQARCSLMSSSRTSCTASMAQMNIIIGRTPSTPTKKMAYTQLMPFFMQANQIPFYANGSFLLLL